MLSPNRIAAVLLLIGATGMLLALGLTRESADLELLQMEARTGVPLAPLRYSRLSRALARPALKLLDIGMGSAPDVVLDTALAWKAIYRSPALNGEPQVLAMIPADPRVPPYFYNLAEKEVIRVTPQDMDAKLADLRPFSEGLAAAGVRKGDSTDTQWGYVDLKGEWRIKPQFVRAGEFHAGVALVDRKLSRGTETDAIGGNGSALKWAAEENLNGARLDPVPGGAVLNVGNKAWLIKSGESDRRIWIGLLQARDTSGQLFASFETDTQPLALWLPGRSPIELPSTYQQVRPVSASLFSEGSYDISVRALDLKVVAKDLNHTEQIAPERFIACKPAKSDRQTCGVMGEKAAWWIKPEYDVIRNAGGDYYIAQSKDKTCLFNALAPAPDCITQQPVPRLWAEASDGRPRTSYIVDGKLEQRQFDRGERFIGPTAVAVEQGLAGLIDESMDWVTPRVQGTPVQQAARLVLAQPWMFGPYSLQPPDGYNYGEPSREVHGSGLIDQAGKWILPPVFAQLYWLEDRSLRAVVANGSYAVRISVKGELLPDPPKPLRTYEEVMAVTLSAAGAVPAPAAQPPGGPFAVSENASRWGFQNEAGDWVIAPKYADAIDFDDGIAAVAMINGAQPEPEAEPAAAGAAPAPATEATEAPQGESTEAPAAETPAAEPAAQAETAAEGSQEGSASEGEGEEGDEANESEGEAAPAKRWGLIDLKGNWVAQPQFAELRDWVAMTAIARDAGSGYYGLIDRKGKWLSEPVFVEVGPFIKGEAVAKRSNNAYCRLQLDGRCTPLTAGDVELSSSHVAMPVQVGNRYGYQRPNGEWQIKPAFSGAGPFFGDYAIASAEPGAGLLTRLRGDSAWVVLSVEKIDESGYSVVRVHDGTRVRQALLDPDGDLVLP